MSLSDIKDVTPTKEEPIVREPKIDKLGRSYATGKRKNSIARVWIKKGSGKMNINGKEAHNYFTRPTLQMMIHQLPLPLVLPAKYTLQVIPTLHR